MRARTSMQALAPALAALTLAACPGRGDQAAGRPAEQPAQAAIGQGTPPGGRIRSEVANANVFQVRFTGTPSVTRADLQVCTELTEAKQVAPRPMEPGALAALMEGTWVRELTWYGVVVESESAMYYDFDGDRFTAMMFDQSNLGQGSLSRELERIRNTQDSVFHIPTITFVDCDYNILDRYYKISDQLVFKGLNVPAAAARAAGDSTPLRVAWDALVASGFFDRKFENPRHVGAERPDEEVLTPSVGGAYWTGTLRPAQVGGQRGASLTMQGEYRGSHVGQAMGNSEEVRFTGTESARFMRDGNVFVATVDRPQRRGLALRAGNLSVDTGGWSTDCAAFFNLPEAVIWERVVIDPGVA